MKVISLDVTNFRGIPNLRLDLHEQVNVLVGINGSGKSAILDCAAIMLSRLIARIRSTKGTGRQFSDSDISNGMSETRNSIEVSFRGETIEWSVTKKRRGARGQTITNLDMLRESVELMRMDLEVQPNTDLPLAVYYPVNRAVLDIPLRIRTKHTFDQLAAYDQALSGEWSSFRLFFEWFREREDLENEKRLDDPRYRDGHLEAVRNAIERFLPGFRGLRVKRSPLRMVVEKDERELTVNQLSDGEKCTLAMVGDMARRMAIANPTLANPLEGEGVALIDEIDLHLHPAWQRRIVGALKETFPNCQFLLTTHSPQVLGHLRPECIWVLERAESGVVANRPEEAFGLESGRILEDIMGVSSRPQEVKNKLRELFLAIDGGKTNKAKRLATEIRRQVGEDPDLVKADILISRREVLGK